MTEQEKPVPRGRGNVFYGEKLIRYKPEKSGPDEQKQKDKTKQKAKQPKESQSKEKASQNTPNPPSTQNTQNTPSTTNTQNTTAQHPIQKTGDPTGSAKPTGNKSSFTPLPKYLISFNHNSNTIASKISTSPRFCTYPNFIKIDSAAKEKEALITGARILVKSFEECEAFTVFSMEILGKTGDFELIDCPWAIEKLGMVFSLDEEEWATVITGHNIRGTKIPIPPGENWQEFDTVDCQTVLLQPGTQVLDEFILPATIDTGTILQKAGTRNDFVISAKKNNSKFEFPAKEFGEFKTIGLAVTAQMVHLKNIANCQSMVTYLHHSRGGYEFTHNPNSIEDLLQFKELWGSDSNFTIRREERGKGIGTGTVKEMYHPDDTTTVNVTVNAYTYNYEDDLVGEPMFLEIPPSTKNLQYRLWGWLEKEWEEMLSEQNLRAEMLRKLCGRDTNLLDASPIDSGWDPLNSQQKAAAGYAANPGAILQAIIASPGTGKTFLLALLARRLVEMGEKVLLIANSNVSLLKLVEDVASQTQTDLLVIQSGMAKDNPVLAKMAAKFKNHLLISHCDPNPEEKVEGKDLKDIERYKKNSAKRPKMADDRTVIGKIYHRRNFGMIFASTAMAEQLTDIYFDMTTLLIDEAGQTPTNAVLPIIAAMPNCKKLIVTGDPLQLGVFPQKLGENLEKYGYDSILNHINSLTASHKTQLTISYRGHPFLTNCLQFAAYGDKIKPGVSEEERSEFIKNVPLPNPKIPFVAVHVAGEDERATHSFSRYNNAQTGVVIDIISSLKLLVPHLSLTVLCLYAHQAQILRYETDADILTIDSFQSQQSDVILVCTTRSVNNPEEKKEVLKFLTNNNRAVVALSRARMGLIVVGDLNTLRVGEVYAKFMEFAMANTEEVGETWVQQLKEFAEKKENAKETSGPTAMAFNPAQPMMAQFAPFGPALQIPPHLTQQWPPHVAQQQPNNMALPPLQFFMAQQQQYPQHQQLQNPQAQQQQWIPQQVMAPQMALQQQLPPMQMAPQQQQPYPQQQQQYPQMQWAHQQQQWIPQQQVLAPTMAPQMAPQMAPLQLPQTSKMPQQSQHQFFK